LRLSGSITALATPFTAAGEIDLDAWRRLLQAQLEGGTQAVVVARAPGDAAAVLGRGIDPLVGPAGV
jgi:4-hydroxy-tetrahydrodipicolinate synthase